MDDSYNSSESIAISGKVMTLTGSKNDRYYSEETVIETFKAFRNYIGAIKNYEPPYPVPVRLDIGSPDDSTEFPPLCDGNKILGCFYKESDDYCITQFLNEYGLDFDAICRLKGVDLTHYTIISGNRAFIINPRYTYHNEYFGNLKYRYLADIYYHIKSRG